MQTVANPVTDINPLQPIIIYNTRSIKMHTTLSILITMICTTTNAQIEPAIVKLLVQDKNVFIDSAILYSIDNNKKDAFLQPHGVWRIRDKENNNISAIIEYSHGKYHGHVISYYSDGTISNSSYYYNGIANGPQISFWGNGVPKTSMYYRNGLKEGIAKSFDTAGKISSIIEFREGKLNGINARFYPSGNIKLITHYFNNDENGVRKEYSDNDNSDLKGEFVMKNGVPISGKFYSNGKLKETITYNYEEELKKKENLNKYIKDGTFIYKKLLSER